jgi:hypothetical protein
MSWMAGDYRTPPMCTELGAGVSFAHTRSDVDRYLDVADEFLGDIVGVTPHRGSL